MTPINLIPDDVKNSQQRQWRQRFWSVLFVLAFCIMCGWVVIKHVSCASYEESTKTLSQKSQQLQEEIKTLNRTRDQLEQWQNRYALLTELDRYTDFLAITGYLSRHSPDLIYLEEMKFSHDEKTTAAGARGAQTTAPGASMFQIRDNSPDSSGGPAPDIQITMFLKGKAFNYAAVSDYMVILQNSGYFSQVHLKNTGRKQMALQSKNPQESVVSIDFVIEGTLNPVIESEVFNYAHMQETQNF
ncbi:MAG: PilN domain-containing protein [Sedimentisphaerales bacterium]|nr:PilN domain-containing protein [Sedimentisphaerales bacterium]